MITLEEFRKEILQNLYILYIKSLFAEHCYPNLVFYSNSGFGMLSSEYFWGVLQEKISNDDKIKILSFISEQEYENIAKNSIFEILKIVCPYIDSYSEIINTFTITPVFRQNLLQNEDYLIKIPKFGENNNNRFFFEYYLKIEDNIHNINSYQLKEIVNPQIFINFLNSFNENIAQDFKNIKFGLRLIYNPGDVNFGDPGEIAKLQKSYYIIDLLEKNFYPIPVAIEEESILYTTSNFNLILQINTAIEKIENLKSKLINSEKCKKLFNQIIPIDCLDIVFASQFNETSLLFKEILKQNKFYLNCSENIMKNINSLIDYKEI